MTDGRGGRGAAILFGGLAAGAFDISYAILFWWFRSRVPPGRILQSVASGLLGRPAYDGGVPTAILGLFLHFLIAFTFAALYVAAAGRVPALVLHPFLWGGLYGALVYAVMNLVVVPLSRFPTRKPMPLDVFLTGLAVHVFLIGVPIALASRGRRPRA